MKAIWLASAFVIVLGAWNSSLAQQDTDPASKITGTICEIDVTVLPENTWANLDETDYTTFISTTSCIGNSPGENISRVCEVKIPGWRGGSTSVRDTFTCTIDATACGGAIDENGNLVNFVEATNRRLAVNKKGEAMLSCDYKPQ